MNEKLNIEDDIPKSTPTKGLVFASDSNKIWLRFLIRNWLLILIFCLIGGAIGYFYSKKQVILYESYLTFSLDDGASSGRSSGYSSLIAQFGLGSSDNNLFSGDNILEVVTSRKILESTLLSVDTIKGKPYTFIDYLNGLYSKHSASADQSQKSKIITFPPGLERKDFTYAQDSVLYFTYLKIRTNFISALRPDKKLSIYQIKFRSPEERFTKVFTEKVLSETVKFYTELKSKKSKETLNSLEQRIISLRGSLNSSISSKASTQDANLNPAFAASQVPLQKQQVDIQVFGGAYAEIYKNLELARFQFLQNIPLVQVIDGVNYPMNRIKPNTIKNIFIGGLLALLFMIFSLTLFHLFSKKK